MYINTHITYVYNIHSYILIYFVDGTLLRSFDRYFYHFMLNITRKWERLTRRHASNRNSSGNVRRMLVEG